MKAEITEKQARSIKYQLTVAKLRLAAVSREFPPKSTVYHDYSTWWQRGMGRGCNGWCTSWRGI